MPITHAKVSGKSDGADATQIQPSDWNDDHVGGGGFDATGSGSPVGTIDPTAQTPGYTYLDTTIGALYMVADIIGTLRWVLLGGELAGLVDVHAGVVLGNGIMLIGPSNQGGAVAGMSDVGGYNDSGAGVYWYSIAADGDQELHVWVGSPRVDALVVSRFGGVRIDGVDLDLSNFSGNVYTGSTLPTADPAVAGQLWNNLGVVMVSDG